MAQKFSGGISWAQNGEKGGEFHFLYSQREQEFLKFLFLPQGQIFIRSGSNLRRLIYVNLYVKYFRNILITTLIPREFEKITHIDECLEFLHSYFYSNLWIKKYINIVKKNLQGLYGITYIILYC